MPKLLGLLCRECGTEYELQATHVCEMCFGPLDVVFDQAVLKKKVSRERIEQGPASMWRYRDLLPVLASNTILLAMRQGDFGVARDLADEFLLPEQTADDTDHGWGEQSDSNDARLWEDVPPHWS